jgi:hypothetical protein
LRNKRDVGDCVQAVSKSIFHAGCYLRWPKTAD